jgi:hypothetical protein
MNIKPDCKVCILNQTYRVLETINVDNLVSQSIIDEVLKILSLQDYNITPPEVADKTYSKISQISKIKDLYKEEKAKATIKAKSFEATLRESINISKNKLLTALKVAVAGNVLDLATPNSFDLSSEIEKIFDRDFAIDDSPLLDKRLQSAKEILILGDNAGEHIFDKIFIETLSRLYPKLSINYATRGIPIINDITFEEAKVDGLDGVCNLIDSGVNTPAFIYERANIKTQDIYDRSDFIISKGMGNFETLNLISDKDIFFIFKVKCQVVSNQIGKPIGEIICKLNKN